MNRIHSVRPLLVLASALALAPSPAAADLSTTSPGELDREVEIASACPTFSWGEASTGVVEARGFELAVFALDDSDRPELVLRRALDVAATSWTPARAECLATGGRYVWSIRAVAAPGRATEWSAPRRFTVPGAPSEEEVANALELLRRWRERNGGPSRASRSPQSTPIAPRGLAPLGGGPAAAVQGTFDGASGVGVSGIAASSSGPVTGVRGETASSSGYGLLGVSTATGNSPIAIRGEISATNGSAVSGFAAATAGNAKGVSGESQGAAGVGVSGIATSTSGPATGVRGETASSSGYGLLGISTATENAPVGVRGEISATSGSAVSGFSTANVGYANGVSGEIHGTAGAGVRGVSHNASATYAYGVYGTSAGPNSAGVYGNTSGPNGLGVWGTSSSTVGGVGVAANSSGTSAMGFDAYLSATTGATRGLRAWVNSPQGIAVHAISSATTGSNNGVLGDVDGTSAIGVFGNSGATNGLTYGVRGTTSSTGGRGVYGGAPNTTGAYAGYFAGRVNVTGTLSKGGGSFKIDHPLEPEQKYLYHSFVESPDMMNVYNGNVTLDAKGEAWVELPKWFDSLNRDFRYQLTPIGQPSMVWVGARIEDNRFLVRGGPGIEVSWQVTGVRQDRWAEAHRIPVEEVKPADEQGTYLHPEEWGLDADQGLDWKLETPVRQAQEARQLEREAEGGQPAWMRAHAAEAALEVDHAPR